MTEVMTKNVCADVPGPAAMGLLHNYGHYATGVPPFDTKRSSAPVEEAPFDTKRSELQGKTKGTHQRDLLDSLIEMLGDLGPTYPGQKCTPP